MAWFCSIKASRLSGALIGGSLFLLGLLAGIAGTRLRDNARDTVVTINGVPIRQQEFLHRLESAGSLPGRSAASFCAR